MQEDFGSDFITITDEDGNNFELELLDALIHNDVYYHAFAPADSGEDDEDLEIILLKTIEKDGEELLSTLDNDEELEQIYALFMERLFEEDES